MSWATDEEVQRVADMRVLQIQEQLINFKGETPTADQMRVGTRVLWKNQIWKVVRNFGQDWDLVCLSEKSGTVGMSFRSLPELQLIKESTLREQLRSGEINGRYFDTEDFFTWRTEKVAPGKWERAMIFVEFDEKLGEKYGIDGMQFEDIIHELKEDCEYWRYEYETSM